MSHHSSDDESESESSSILTEEESESGEEELEAAHSRGPVEYTITKGVSSTPAKSQKALLAEAAHTQEPPSWLKKALKPRASVAVEVEEKRKSQMVQSAEKQEMPEWIEKSKRMSRDVRGLERYFKMKPPDLPPEPEWVGKATKRRDLSVLVHRNNLQTHEANKEAPDWVKEGAFSKKILSAFLQSDAEISPDWMEESRAMSPEEKKQLLDKIEELRKVLEEEERLTSERKKILAEANEAHASGEEALASSRSALDAVKAGEGGELVGLADAADVAFAKAGLVFEGIRATYGIVVPEQILEQVEDARAVAEGGEEGEKARKKHKKKKSKRAEGEGKKKKSKKKRTRDPNETSEEKRERRAARAQRKEERRVAREEKKKSIDAKATEGQAADALAAHTKHSDPAMLQSSHDSPLTKKKKKQEKEKKKKAK